MVSSLTMHAPITLLYGALAALLATLLGVAVSLARLKYRASVGAPIEGPLLRLVRAHGNNAEWSALGVVLLLLLELGGGASTPLHVFGGLLVLTRVVHALNMIFRLPIGTGNATLHYGLFLAMAGYGLMLRFG